MNYLVRINYHEDDMAKLVLNGLMPAVTIARDQLSGVKIGFRNHWLRGQHLLIAFDDAVTQHGQLAICFIGQINSWISANPSQSRIDASAYKVRSKQLAEMEAIDEKLLPLRSNNTVSDADYKVPLFLGDGGLSKIRDWFMAEALDDIFEITGARSKSSAASVVALVLRILMVEHVSSEGNLDFWPVSPKGQVSATSRFIPSAREAYGNLTKRIIPRLVEHVRCRGVLDISKPLCTADGTWVAKLCELNRRIRARVSELDDDYFIRLAKAALYAESPNELGLTVQESAILMASREYHAYRAFMNMLYALFPVTGHTISHRLLACRLISDILDEHAPLIVDRARIRGAELLGRFQSLG